MLTADYVRSTLFDLLTSHGNRPAIPLEDFQQLLRDALTVGWELGESDDRRPPRIGICRPSLPHWQNRGFRDWVSLIELLRDS